ncbi:unnamed protein product [Blepharisma stoltei]|uniref:Mitochondrial carrier protein n=1 Tax=Blepharisma stoltei TaxID=1481888 RepID=A0AAU9JZ30_9CILI|nr:unnamed protein product [Blepharisma stoltei]
MNCYFLYQCLYPKINMAEVVAGFFQGLGMALSSYPLDTIKVRMQSGNFSSVNECIKNSFKNHGLFGFYRGVGSLIYTSPLRSSMSLALYNNARNRLKCETPFYNGIGAGAITGGFMASIVCPIEVIKCSIQTSSQKLKTLEYAKTLYKNHGIKIFYQGLKITLLRELVGFSVFFGTYEHMKTILVNKYQKIPSWGYFLAGSVSGVICTISVFPIDTIKTVFQTNSSKLTYPQTVKFILSSRGALGFWKGLLPSALRSLISFGTGFFAYEQVKSCLLSIS